MFFKKKILFLAFFIFLFCFVNGCSKTILNEPVNSVLIERAKYSKLIVLDVFHNRCESCKLIEPVMKQLEEKYSQDLNVVFLKYDLSNPITVFRSKREATLLGLEDIYKSQRYSGVVLFINTGTKEVVRTLIAENDIEKYLEIIDSTLNSSK